MEYTHLVSRYLPPLKIHTWGGFGSQLFSIALGSELLGRYPKRRILIVLHTGGVTRRLPEVVDLYPEFEYAFIDDHEKLQTLNIGKRNRINSITFKCFKACLRTLGFIQNSNNDLEFSSIKPWTLSLRGHYSYRSISEEFLCSLDMRLQKMHPELISGIERNLCLHYRLGDLLDLEEKPPLPSEKILERIEEFLSYSIERKVVLFSDSPDEAVKRLKSNNVINFLAPEGDTTEVIRQAVQSIFFIGTSSKISFWIAAIRGSVYGRKSALPSINKNQYSKMLGSGRDLVTPFD